jgi:hypothetical protein
MRSKEPSKQNRAIRLKEVNVETQESGQCRISVQLNFRGKTITGERTGPDEADYKIMLAAQSTIDALYKATEERVRMDLLFIERQSIEKVGREVIMVLIDVNTDEEARAATGACQVKGDPIQAAARAVLDATNRIIELYFE